MPLTRPSQPSTRPSQMQASKTSPKKQHEPTAHRDDLPALPTTPRKVSQRGTSFSSCSRSRKSLAVEIDSSSDEESDDELLLKDAADIQDERNKENVALVHSAADDTQSENMLRSAPASEGQERGTQTYPSTPRRTRGRASLPCTPQSPITSQVTPSRTRRRAQPQSALATPASRKRRRITTCGLAVRKEAESDAEALDFDAIRSTPMSRLRLDPSSPSAGAEGYASSQGSSIGSAATALSSIFDDEDGCAAESGETSRSTSPDADAKDKETDTATEASQPSSFSNVYAHARSLLRCAAGTALDASSSPQTSEQESLGCSSEARIVGRDPERRAIHVFLAKRFGLFARQESEAPAPNLEDILDGDADSGSLYVCGLPGTGKTALVRSVLMELLEGNVQGTDDIPRIAFINCMAVQDPRQIFAKVMIALGEHVKGATASHAEAEAERRMNKLVKDHDRKTLVVLDEIDHLLKSRAHQNVLYRLFSWASSDSACSLIGIANSLDLTERFVPLLASKGAAPALMSFRPFESTEIVEVIKARLGGLQDRYDEQEQPDGEHAAESTSSNSLPLFTPTALELAAKKIAAATGDLRKALDAARLSIELVEADQRRPALNSCAAPSNSATPKPDARKLLAHLTPASAPKVTPQHIIKVLSVVLGSPSLGKIRQLGLQPKLMLAAYVIAEKRFKAGMPVLGSGGRKTVAAAGVRMADVESTYGAMLSNDGGFSALESSEILEVFEGLEVQGIIALRIASSQGRPAARDESDAVPGSSVQTLASPSVTTSSRVSPAGKRAAKKQLLASNRLVQLLHPIEDIQKGITTVAPAGPGARSAGGAAEADAAAQPSKAVVEAIKVLLHREEERIRKSRGWEQVVKEREEVRREELGGGRIGISAAAGVEAF